MRCEAERVRELTDRCPNRHGTGRLPLGCHPCPWSSRAAARALPDPSLRFLFAESFSVRGDDTNAFEMVRELDFILSRFVPSMPLHDASATMAPRRAWVGPALQRYLSFRRGLVDRVEVPSTGRRSDVARKAERCSALTRTLWSIL